MPNEYGEDTDLPASWSKWPTSEEAARRLGISVRQLGRYIRRGLLKRHQSPDGGKAYRFSPDDLKEFAEKMVEEGGLDVGDNDLPQDDRTLKEANDLVRQAQGHIERTFERQANITDQLIQHLRSELAIRNERVRYLEEKQNEVAVLRENLLNEAHFRNLAQVSAEKKDNRKDKAVGLVINRLPGILDKLETAAIGDTAQAKAVVGLLKGFDRDTLVGLLEVDILTPEQKAQVRTILGMPQPVPELKPDATSIDTSIEEST